MHSKKNSNILAIIACLLWATAFAGIKIGLEYTSPLRFAGLRFIIAGLLILPFIKNIKHEFSVLNTNWGKLLLISLFQTFGLYLLFYLGISRSPASATAVVVGAGPLVIAILAHFAGINESFGWKKGFAILVGFVGIIVIALSKNKGADERSVSFFGLIILLASNVSGGIGNVLITRYKLPGSPLLKNAVQLFLGGLGLFLVSLLIEPQNFAIKPTPYYISLGWLSFISAGAFSLWFIVLHRDNVKVSEINIWKFIIPVIGASLSWLLIPSDKPNFNYLIGAVFVGVSLILMNLKRGKDQVRR